MRGDLAPRLQHSSTSSARMDLIFQIGTPCANSINERQHRIARNHGAFNVGDRQFGRCRSCRNAESSQALNGWLQVARESFCRCSSGGHREFLAHTPTHFLNPWIRYGEERMKRFLFLLLAAGGMMFVTASEASAQHYSRGHGHHGHHGHGHGYRHGGRGFSINFNRGFRGGYGYGGRGFSINFNRGFRGGYGYGGHPVRRSVGISYGYAPQGYSSAYYGGGGYYGGGCGY